MDFFLIYRYLIKKLAAIDANDTNMLTLPIEHSDVSKLIYREDFFNGGFFTGVESDCLNESSIN